MNFQRFGQAYSNKIIQHGPFEIPIKLDFFFLQNILEAEREQRILLFLC